MNIQLRPLRLPDDYAPLAELLNLVWSEPTSARRLEEDDAKLYEVGHTWKDENGLLGGYDRTRRAAVTEEGRIVGYIWSWRAPWTEPGYLCNTLIVAPGCRKRGIGKQLLAHAAEWAQSLGAAALLAEVWDDQPESLRFAKQYGFAVERHAYQSVLPLKTGANQRVENEAASDVCGIAGAVGIEAEAAAEASPERLLAAQGLRLLTLADEPGEASERKLYELSAETIPDIPGFLGDVPDFDQWKKWYLEVDGFNPQLVLIAADSDRFVGMTNVIYNKTTNGLYHEYTGVSRGYRGRGVAQALKLKAIQLGKRRGADYIRTDNDSMNGAILSINRRLGYEPLRGNYRVIAPLNSVMEALQRGKQ